MLLASISKLMVFAALATPSGATPGDGVEAASQALLPDLVHTRQTAFAIPFRLDRQVNDPSLEPAEVRLYVSADRGASWQLYNRAAPTSERFRFRVGVDGELWFSVVTIDRSGRARPEGTPKPGLRVAVDTRPPRLMLQAQRGQAGQVTAKWQADEVNIKPESLKIQYRVNGGIWKTVAVNSTIAASPAGAAGEVTWYPSEGNGLVEVRAEVTDAAGNPAVNSARIEALAVAPQANPPIADMAVAAPADGSVPNSTQWPAENTTSTPLSGGNPSGQQPIENPSDRYTAERYTTTAGQLGPAGADRPTDRLQQNRYAADRYPVDMPGGGSDPSTNPTQATPPQATPPQTPYRPTSQVASEWRGAAENTAVANHMPVHASPTNDSVAAVVNPPLRSEYKPSPDMSGGPASAHQAFRLPSGERPKMVSSRAFELQYDVESAGPAGVTRVELWGTRDGGRTWQVITVDDDNRSPLQAVVKEDGIYGFRIVVHSGGQSAASPQSGDLPHAWLGVDTTKPTARLLTAAQQNVQGEESLAVTWEAADGMLGDRPISLLFAESPAGPWTSIAAGLENSGQYVWRLDARVPNQVYMRMEVRDAAGNMEQVDLPSPVSIRRPQPSVRIRDVRPLGTTARGQMGRYTR